MKAPVDFPAHDEVTRRGWKVVWGHRDDSSDFASFLWGYRDDIPDFGYWLEVRDSQGQVLAKSMTVQDCDGVWLPWEPHSGQAEPVDMDAEAERICAEAIRREQARVDRERARLERRRARSRLSRAWAAITGKDE